MEIQNMLQHFPNFEERNASLPYIVVEKLLSVDVLLVGLVSL